MNKFTRFEMSLAGLFLLTMANISAQEQKDSLQTDSIAAHAAEKVQADSLIWEKLLEGVTVKAQRQLVKTEIDRIEYDVQGDEDAKTENVLDMLRKVPFVAVDAQDNIQVKGSGQFKIYKNGRYDPSWSKNATQIFRAMPASSVKRVEVITDPGAKEDAEGVNAILNIVMMENKGMEGIMGSVTGSYSTMEHSNLGTSLTTQLGKTILSVDYGFNHMSGKVTENHSISEEYLKESGNHTTYESSGSNPGDVHYADLNFSYDIDTLNLISASFGGYFYNVDVNGGGTVDMFDAAGNHLFGYSNRYWLPSYRHHSWDGRMDFEHRTKRKGEAFTFSYMLALTCQQQMQETNYSDLFNAPFTYTASWDEVKERFTEHTFQADWTRPLWKGHKLSVGAKYIGRRNSSRQKERYDQEELYPETDSRFCHDTRISAAYLDYTLTAGKWSARAGVRYEHSYIKGRFPDGSASDFHKHLNDWVPQASVKYQMTDRQSIKLGYTTSIARPGISYLNPAVVKSPTSVSYGNPHLNSNHSQMMVLNYMYTGARLTLQVAPAVRFFSDGIGTMKYVVDDIRYTTRGNLERFRRWMLESYVQWKPFDTTTISINLNLWSDRIDNSSQRLRQKGWGGFAYLNASQQLPWNLRFSIFTWGSLGHTPNNVYSYSRSYMVLGASLQRSFLKEDRLTVQLRATSPFARTVSFKNVYNQGDYTGFDKMTQDVRRLQLSVSYRFGKLKASVKKAERSIENTDVVGGITKSGD